MEELDEDDDDDDEEEDDIFHSFCCATHHFRVQNMTDTFQNKINDLLLSTSLNLAIAHAIRLKSNFIL